MKFAVVLCVISTSMFFGEVDSAAASSNALFHVQIPRRLFDEILQWPNIDIWKARLLVNDVVHAEIYTSASTMDRLQASGAVHEVTLRRLNEVDDQAIEEQLEIAACHEQTADYLTALNSGTSTTIAKFTANQFFDCWRTADEIFTFLDALVAKNAKYMKIVNATTTSEGRSVLGYKISTGDSTESAKKALYTQSLIHPREWQSGSALLYVMAGFLDGLAAQDPGIVNIFKTVDWYFVPIVNLDGYLFTWENTSNRFWRKNRRVIYSNGENYIGVDLNRNFGPVEFFALDGSNKNPELETFPGESVLSEPETSGIYAFLQSIPHLSGVIDIHTYAQSVLRPFGNQPHEAAEPFGTKLKVLGDAVRDAIQGKDSNVVYDSAPSYSGLYFSYGTFKDCAFLEFDRIPSYTLELEGEGFITPQTSIRAVAVRTLAAFETFSTRIEAYFSQ